MPIVTYNGESFSCTRAAKGANYIELYDGNDLSVKFSGIVDFSLFTISDGEWSTPYGSEEVRATATLSEGVLAITTDGEVGSNTLVKFKAPCECPSVTAGVRINGESYDVVDANGAKMTGPGVLAWASDALVSLLIDCASHKAYIQNSAAVNAYTKEQCMSDDIRSALSLPNDAAPVAALGKMSALFPHWWKRRRRTVTIGMGDEIQVAVHGRSSSTSSGTYSYYPEVALDPVTETVAFAGTKKTTSSLSYSEPTNAQVIVGNYFTPYDYSGIYYATSYVGKGRKDGSDYYFVFLMARRVFAQVTYGEWEYLYSTDRNAYPVGITDYNDGYEYIYLGVPFDNARDGVRIEYGSYTGTGTAGSANPTTLTFGFVPKLVIIERSTTVNMNSNEGTTMNWIMLLKGVTTAYVREASDNGSDTSLYVTWDSHTVSWYHTDSYKYATSQLNTSGYKYYYVAIG